MFSLARAFCIVPEYLNCNPSLGEMAGSNGTGCQITRAPDLPIILWPSACSRGYLR